MAKKQTMIERTLLAMAVGESLAYLPSSKQEILVHQPDNFTDPLKWGANTSMSLATVSSLSRGYQFNDVMLRLQNWYKRRQYAPAQTIQSIDDVIQSSMLRFSKNRDLLASGGVDEASNSDSVLARMVPVALYLHHRFGSAFINDERAMLLLHRVAGLTHNHEGALVSVGMLSLIISQILDGKNLFDSVENGLAFGFEYYSRHQVFAGELKDFDAMNLPDFSNSSATDFKLDGQASNTLEAVVWSLLNSENYQDALNKALMHGHANTMIPTLAGTLAGIYYKEDEQLNIISQQLVSRKLIISISHLANRLGRFN